MKAPKPLFSLPSEFAEGTIRREGEAGRVWLERLPSLLKDLCERWQLVLDGPPLHGGIGLVFPVRRGEARFALKLTWRDAATLHEELALRTWAGNGAVKLIDATPIDGALLLEHLDSGRTLETVNLEKAVRVAGQLYARLAVKAPQGVPHQEQVTRRIVDDISQRWESLNRPFPTTWLDRACALALELAEPEKNLLINWDLHYGNVLAGEREPWLAIDPKVIAGDKEFGVAQLFWCRFEPDEQNLIERRFDILCDLAELDRAKAYAWTYVRCIDYWLWGLSVGLTEDPLRCGAIMAWLDSKI